MTVYKCSVGLFICLMVWMGLTDLQINRLEKKVSVLEAQNDLSS